MIKKLRRKIVLINMTLVSLVLLIAFVIVGYSSVEVTAQELYRSLHHAANLSMQTEHADTNDFQDRPAEVPHIIASMDENQVWDILHNDITMDADSLIHALIHIQSTNEPEEILFPLRLAYVRCQTPEGPVIVLGDAAMVLASFRNILVVGGTVFAASMILMFLIILMLTNMALRPTEHAWQQQKQFIADASHELKTPLTVINANNNIVLSHPEETVRQQTQWLHSTAEELRQMRELIDEMLTLARAESGQFTASFQPTDVSSLLEEELLFLEPVAYEKQIELVMQVEKQITIVTDATLFKKLAVILVDNAIKHGSTGTPVTITLTGGRTPSLWVHNYGPAIPKEDLPHLFDRFYRSDRSRSTSGYGLGLAIAHAMVQQLKAKLTVTSSEETGTTFTVLFK